jgi:hypothetical protein
MMLDIGVLPAFVIVGQGWRRPLDRRFCGLSLDVRERGSREATTRKEVPQCQQEPP